MPSFDITTSSTTLRLDSDRRAKVSFTVSNRQKRPLRGLAKVKALDSTKQEWLEIVGAREREFSSEGTHDFTVELSLPPDARESSYRFRLDVACSENPDEDFTEGPAVFAEVSQAEEPTKPFPWWIAAAAALVVAAGVVIWLWPRPFQVPSLVGRSLEEAQQLVEDKNLVLEIDEEEFTSAETTPGTVLSQKPDGGRVMKGDVVRVVVESGFVEVPGFMGQTENAAHRKLLEFDLNLDLQKSGRRKADDNQHNRIVKQEPPEGTPIERRSEIVLIVGDKTTTGRPWFYGTLGAAELKATLGAAVVDKRPKRQFSLSGVRMTTTVRP